MAIDARAVYLRRLADNTTRARAAARALFTPPTPADHDDAVEHPPGTIRVDTVTGQTVEIVRGQRTSVFLETPREQTA